jgi:dTDP-4-dehydrorhamnose reductase
MSVDVKKSGVAVWAGIECTINRVGNAYHDQLEYLDHYRRGTSDLEAVAGLGIEALRYPVLWEHHEPKKGMGVNWEFASAGLNKLREQHVNPIVGLVHHGSGPRWVSFMDGSFETGLQEYARQVALQFPWVEYYTPVNEPLTTARFCGMYGHWYPHGKSIESFVRVLVSECKATLMAMEAIREINPAAKLIQTEDLGKTYSTPLLQYQADLENRRRWLSIDLIGGKITPEHPMWQYLLKAGVGEEELYYFIEHGRLPDIIGLNYYTTSERYIDEALEHYPAHTHGGNGIHKYADVEAVSVPVPVPTGIAALLRGAWERYRHPMAITEVHLGGTREQQARWLHQSWQLSNTLRNEGIDIRAITAWAAFGMYGWNELCRYPRGLYEPGLFDIRSGKPRPTALANMVQKLCKERECSHPILERKGWWEQESRLRYRVPVIAKPATQEIQDSCRPLLILGKTGTLGRAFARLCKERDIYHVLWGRQELDITQQEAVAHKIAALRPWAVINTTGYVRVNDAEAENDLCQLINCTGAVTLAKACAELGVRYVSFSSDMVFDGKKGTAYTELDAVSPINAYGRSKAAAEEGILKHHEDALVVRTSSFFSPWDEYNFVHLLLSQLAYNKPFAAAADVIVSPTYVPHLVGECLDLLLDDASGIWHITNGDAMSWAQFARKVARLARLDESLIQARSQKQLGWSAPHPRNSALSTKKGIELPTVAKALDSYFEVVPYFRKDQENVCRPCVFQPGSYNGIPLRRLNP